MMCAVHIHIDLAKNNYFPSVSPTSPSAFLCFHHSLKDFLQSSHISKVFPYLLMRKLYSFNASNNTDLFPASLPQKSHTIFVILYRATALGRDPSPPQAIVSKKRIYQAPSGTFTRIEHPVADFVIILLLFLLLQIQWAACKLFLSKQAPSGLL